MKCQMSIKSNILVVLYYSCESKTINTLWSNMSYGIIFFCVATRLTFIILRYMFIMFIIIYINISIILLLAV